MNLLNYKYEIFPTKPQRAQLYRILRESKYQWNKAVTIRKKLKAALVLGQFEYVINTCLSAEKSNTQGQRVNAIERFRSQYPEMKFETATQCYDIKNLIGKVLGDTSQETLLDLIVVMPECFYRASSFCLCRGGACPRPQWATTRVAPTGFPLKDCGNDKYGIEERSILCSR